MDFENTYPHLFKEVIWPWGPTRAQFEFLDNLPPAALIANVNIVPRVGNSWLILQHHDGLWDIPGGTLEEDEGFTEALRRELLEEAGARLGSLIIFGAWHCYSLASEPYRAHLPHPEYYRIVGVGDVEVVQSPENPETGEKVISVEAVSLEVATSRFRQIGRFDLADLYQMAAEVSASGFHKNFDVM